MASQQKETVIPQHLQERYETLRQAWRKEQGLAYQRRMQLLDKLATALVDWETRLADAVSEDFGNRSRHETAMAEIFVALSGIRHMQKHLRHWMRPESRGTSWVFMPAKNRVIYQPLGIVGVMGPWNYPIQLIFAPVAAAIAAGNRVLIKPSELTPKTAEVVEALLAEVFDETEVAVVTGGPEIGAAFSRLPFDHLFFTGSTSVGRLIMKSAAENLVPVTLELGGKSPVIVDSEYAIPKAARRIAVGKLLNAGQTCIAPDYALVHLSQVEAFEKAYAVAVRELYPTLVGNPDYTSIVNDRHYARLQGLVDEARESGARVVTISDPEETIDPATRIFPPTLVLGATASTKVMQDEIFGPILPIIPYANLDDAIEYINDRPRPLALYFFSHDRDATERVLSETISGGVSINDTLYHVAQDDLPFGGVGASGIGSYHGREGFETFSHKKAIFSQARLNSVGLLAPPYGGRVNKLLDLLVGKGKR